MATHTRTELANQALKNVGAFTPGMSAPSAEDFATANDAIPGVIDLLSAEEIYEVGDPEEIEASAFLPLAVFVADAIKEEFGGQYDVAAAELRLRRLSASGPTGEVAQVEYY